MIPHRIEYFNLYLLVGALLIRIIRSTRIDKHHVTHWSKSDLCCYGTGWFCALKVDGLFTLCSKALLRVNLRYAWQKSALPSPTIAKCHYCYSVCSQEFTLLFCNFPSFLERTRLLQLLRTLTLSRELPAERNRELIQLGQVGCDDREEWRLGWTQACNGLILIWFIIGNVLWR